MLVNNLSESTKTLNRLIKIENAALDAEKKSNDDETYKNTVDDFSRIMHKIELTFKEIDFEISETAISMLEDNISNLESVIESGVVDSDCLIKTRKNIMKKTNPLLSKEWKAFHKSKALGCVTKINSIGKLAKDPDKIKTIKENISDGNDWSELKISEDGTCSKLELLKNGIDEVNKFEDSLNLSEPVREFISLVTQKKAKVTDINEEVIKWIIAEQMEEKFTINFNK